MPEEPIEELEPGEVFADRVREIRKALGWTQEELARRLIRLHGEAEDAANLHTWRMVVTRTESRARKATLEDLFQFAAALGVSPVAVLVQPEGVMAVGSRRLAPGVVRAWLGGITPLRRADVDTDAGEDAWFRFSRRASGPYAHVDLRRFLEKRRDSDPDISLPEDTHEMYLAFISKERKYLQGMKEWAEEMPADQRSPEYDAGFFDTRLAELDEWEAAIERIPRRKDESKPRQRKETKDGQHRQKNNLEG